MKKIFLTAIVLGLLNPLSLFAQSQRAGNDGGGGHVIRNAFRLRAAELILMVQTTPEADAICSSDIMKTAYDSHQVKIVSILKDLKTGQPIADQLLQAYTQAGVIQLLEAPWQKQLIDTPKSGEDLTASDALILHELYRATGKFCPDEKEARSTSVIQILRQKRNRYTKWFSLYKIDTQNMPKVPTLRKSSLYDKYTEGLCTKDLSICLQIFMPTRCDREGETLSSDLILYKKKDETETDYAPFTKSPSEETKCAKIYSFPFSTYINGIMGLMDENTTFHLVIDLQTGNWLYGIDPLHLRVISIK